MKKQLLFLSLLLLLVTAMTGCNTVSGVGRDVSALGSDVSSGARAVSRSMSNH